MAKVSGETGGWFSIFHEGPITWMPPEVLEGGQAPPAPPYFSGPWARFIYAPLRMCSLGGHVTRGSRDRGHAVVGLSLNCSQRDYERVVHSLVRTEIFVFWAAQCWIWEIFAAGRGGGVEGSLGTELWSPRVGYRQSPSLGDEVPEKLNHFWRPWNTILSIICSLCPWEFTCDPLTHICSLVGSAMSREGEGLTSTPSLTNFEPRCDTNNFVANNRRYWTPLVRWYNSSAVCEICAICS